MPRPREFDDDAAVDAAMETFWTHGYEATTTAQLCESTGLGRGSLYNAFGSKHRLYELALDRYTERGYQDQVDILRAPGTAGERLRALLVWVIDIDLADSAHRGCLALNAATEAAGRTEPVMKLTRRHCERLEDVLREVIENGQRDGEFRADQSARQLARTLLSTYYGLRTLGKITDDRAALMDVTDGALAALH
ncbi:TetR/AcrR family transcriptional regulator [Pseudonocardia spinosispora]|uniref:TetR/AcrR family transcriptional regulator n=1 Tax=Pseudonocardia spinosispora TaxID=103441 RepID=UPI000421FDC3|nr:TetR/AcrR family transcriptional regulator [Pseudonocardia spinosispora]